MSNIFATFLARKGAMMAIVVILIALGTGHAMQTLLADQNAAQGATPAFPNPPEEALVPVVLKTPPAPRWPETFG